MHELTFVADKYGTQRISWPSLNMLRVLVRRYPLAWITA